MAWFTSWWLAGSDSYSSSRKASTSGVSRISHSTRLLSAHATRALRLRIFLTRQRAAVNLGAGPMPGVSSGSAIWRVPECCRCFHRFPGDPNSTFWFSFSDR
jgi:hypothetical protein